MAKNNDYDEFIKATQAGIKAAGAEHKNQFANYLAEYNKTAKNPVRDETDKYKVKTGSKGGFGTNYIAQSGVANGASNPQKNEPVNEEKTTPPMQSTGTGADVAPITGSSKADANYARISDAYEKYKAGDIDETTFRVMTGTTPDIWEKTSGRLKQDANDYRTQQIVDNRTRQTMNTLPDEERHMFQAQLEDNWVNPTREDFDMNAARAAIQAQQKGMAQQKRYEDLMARYNSSKLVGEPYDEPLGPPAPTATQNYGNYYDGRSGNQYPETEKVVNPENVVASNPYRDQTTYGNVFSPYSPYVSGQSRTPAKDSTLRYYPTPKMPEAAAMMPEPPTPVQTFEGLKPEAAGVFPDHTGDTKSLPNFARELLEEYEKNQPLGPYAGEEPPKVTTNPLDTLKGGWDALFNYNGTPTMAEPEEAPAPATNPVNVVPSNPHRDQTAYGYNYSPYSPYESGQPRTPAKDSTLRYYPTPSEEASQTDTPAVDPYSPMGVYQQNQGVGAGLNGNPSGNPEAAALLQEYDNRMAAHNSWMPPDPRTIYQDAAHGNMTPDQRNASIYNQLVTNGMSKAEILEWAQTEAENYMSPEEAMRFYFYVDNH